MNSKPHIHALKIQTGENYWDITYGDQTKVVSRPIFRDSDTVLRNAIKKIIADHDQASMAAEEITKKISRDAIHTAELAAKLQPQDPNKWGSDEPAR